MGEDQTARQAPGASWVWQPAWPVDLQATLGSLARGGGDPTLRFVSDGLWWATWLLDRPVTLQLRVDPGDRCVRARAWGETATAFPDQLPGIAGAEDVVDGFVPRHPVVAEAWRRYRGWRVPSTGRVLEALAPAVLEQQVTGAEARSAWRRLVTRYGMLAPGPTPVPMRVPPPAATWASIPEWEWYQAGVTPQRRRTLVRAASVGRRLDALAGLPADRAGPVLRELPGVGAWTEAEVRQRAFGDPDTVSVGDSHLALQVSWALTGERGRRGDDDRMLDLLEPYRGHRYRVQRLIELAGIAPPRRGPRYSPAARQAVMNPRPAEHSLP